MPGIVPDDLPGDRTLKKASEYRQHAQECRALARTTQTDDHRTQLVKMAETWEALAAERERMVAARTSLDGAFEIRDPAVALPRDAAG